MKCLEDNKANFDKAILHIKEAAGNGAQIVCTQELFKSPYFCQVENPDHFDLAEVIDEKNPTIKKL
ncbi:MAG: carbon-nitrogen hydrolase, partial [Chloroflexota bacterium]